MQPTEQVKLPACVQAHLVEVPFLSKAQRGANRTCAAVGAGRLVIEKIGRQRGGRAAAQAARVRCGRTEARPAGSQGDQPCSTRLLNACSSFPDIPIVADAPLDQSLEHGVLKGLPPARERDRLRAGIRCGPLTPRLGQRDRGDRLFRGHCATGDQAEEEESPGWGPRNGQCPVHGVFLITLFEPARLPSTSPWEGPY